VNNKHPVQGNYWGRTPNISATPLRVLAQVHSRIKGNYIVCFLKNGKSNRLQAPTLPVTSSPATQHREDLALEYAHIKV